MKHEEEQLYICDHAGMPNCAPNCQGNKPHDSKKDPIVCGYTKVLVKHIPYTPPDDIGPYTLKENYSAALLDDKEESEMKRVAVIWFGEVSVSDLGKTYSICLNDESCSGKLISDVELIDADRVVEEISAAGSKYEFRVIKIKPKPAPQETVKEVLADMSEVFDLSDDDSLTEWSLFITRLKAAKEREGNSVPRP